MADELPIPREMWERVPADVRDALTAAFAAARGPLVSGGGSEHVSVQTHVFDAAGDAAPAEPPRPWPACQTTVYVCRGSEMTYIAHPKALPPDEPDEPFISGR